MKGFIRLTAGIATIVVPIFVGMWWWQNRDKTPLPPEQAAIRVISPQEHAIRRLRILPEIKAFDSYLQQRISRNASVGFKVDQKPNNPSWPGYWCILAGQNLNDNFTRWTTFLVDSETGAIWVLPPSGNNFLSLHDWQNMPIQRQLVQQYGR